ncbi:MAG TPA: hypothetical protein ENK07_05655 [Bacteroidetes bacterium]|nr:hypothetical protein [Bacteroidota bacterium]
MKGRKALQITVVAGSILVVALAGCQKKTETKTGGPSAMRGTLQELVDTLQGKTEVLTLGGGESGTIVVTPTYGARVLGAGVSGMESENHLWANSLIATSEFWKKQPREWNLGGARTWIAPEDRFYLDKQDNWSVPPQMDPGNYSLVSKDERSVTCANEFDITSRDDQSYHVKVTRHIRLLDALPEGFPAVSQDVKWVSFETLHELENLGQNVIGKDVKYMGLWSLDQVLPGGTMIIPINKSEKPPYRDYFEPVPPERISVTDEAITLKIDGKRRGKIGVAPWAAKPILLLYEPKANGQAVLFVKQFPVDPNGVYVDHPWGKPSDYGDPVQIYNDSGDMGGFAEMECHGAAQVLEPGAKESLKTTLTVLEGPADELKALGEKLTGLDFGKLKFYE